ncbi:MAG: DUF896 domain-containing protein [Bacilli bacterium]|jgi:uncharacterized protein YnzC (UPF0291/DUF896 family)|nr:DUF896 domain-containing protein [Bacilli bacterium]
MIDKKLIARINELALKKKNEGLSKKELKEQEELRARYISLFRKGLEQRLDNTKIIDALGNEIYLKNRGSKENN